MKCIRCGKEMDREGDSETTLKGIQVDVKLDINPILPEDIAYFNKQLGKYSDGNGECHVVLCYECYLDNYLNIDKTICLSKGVHQT